MAAWLQGAEQGDEMGRGHRPLLGAALLSFQDTRGKEVRCCAPGWPATVSAARGLTPTSPHQGTTAQCRPPSQPEGRPALCLLPSAVPQNSWAHMPTQQGQELWVCGFWGAQGFTFKGKEGVVEDEMFRWHC